MKEQDWKKLPYYRRAWLLGMIMHYMNDEDAYYNSGWLYIWPDGETYDQCIEDFNTKESYTDLEGSFIRRYRLKEYHKAGLFSSKQIPDEVIEAAHFWDDKLGLPHIEVIKPRT